MEINSDTIAAIATPPGTGGIAVIRLSGSKAIQIFSKIWKGSNPQNFVPATAHLGYISALDNSIIDQVVATFFKNPHSFTGEDTIEISCHGSQLIQQQILHTLIEAGARIAQPGEFTQRAFLNGRIDLAQAEGIADLIAASSQAAHDIAISQTKGQFSAELETLRQQLLHFASMLELELDFTEEEVIFANRDQLLSLATQIKNRLQSLTDSYSTGQAIKHGIAIALAGIPNAGKSTLLNKIIGEDKAIISDIPGTTRDIIEATINVKGLQFRFIDTAGLRHTSDTIESLGINRALNTIAKADYIIWLIDASAPIPFQIDQLLHNLPNLNNGHLTLFISKSDLLSNPNQLIETIRATITKQNAPAKIHISSGSALTGHGIEQMIELIARTYTEQYNPRLQTIITNARHYDALLNSLTAIKRVEESLRDGLSADMTAHDLREVLHHLGTITGTITTPEILSSIFSRFCIGK